MSEQPKTFLITGHRCDGLHEPVVFKEGPCPVCKLRREVAQRIVARNVEILNLKEQISELQGIIEDYRTELGI